jgi:hypothetical protein
MSVRPLRGILIFLFILLTGYIAIVEREHVNPTTI